MTSRRGRLSLRREASIPEAAVGYWEIPNSEPHPESDLWISRFWRLNELQPYLERAMHGLAPHDEAELSTDFAEPLEDMIVLSNDDGESDLRSLQSELFMCMFQDIGLVSRAFTVEIGLKALLKLSDQSFPNRHKLR